MCWASRSVLTGSTARRHEWSLARSADRQMEPGRQIVLMLAVEGRCPVTG
jgi:hypothetical protein